MRAPGVVCREIQGSTPGRVCRVGRGGQDVCAFARWYRRQAVEQWRRLDLGAIAALADALMEAERAGRRIYVMGNGGSAAAASHIATDLSKTASVPRRPRLRCLSLSENLALLTAISNDLSFEDVFSYQLENLLEPRDVTLFVSGSGNSPNLLKAARLARARGAVSAALLGFDGGKLRRLVDIPVWIPSDQYGVIEDMHLGVGHILAFFLRQRR